MPEFIVPFTLTADQVNALDTTPINLGTYGLDTKSSVAVPTRLEICRAAGTPYTITQVSGSVLSTIVTELDSMTSEVFTTPPAKELLIRRADARGQRGDVLFKIPTGLLETTQNAGLVIMPEPGLVNIGGDVSLFIEAGTTIASGTGGLSGKIYFTNYFIPV